MGTSDRDDIARNTLSEAVKNVMNRRFISAGCAGCAFATVARGQSEYWRGMRQYTGHKRRRADQFCLSPHSGPLIKYKAAAAGIKPEFPLHFALTAAILTPFMGLLDMRRKLLIELIDSSELQRRD